MGPEAHLINEEEYDGYSDNIGHDFRELEAIPRREGDLLLSSPEPQQRLGWFSVMCIICNRMIGTGIFNTGSKVIQYTQSVGVTLLLWLGGALCAIAGIFVFIEYGLTSPRYDFGARHGKISVPRNGGELHYLKDLLKKPAFLTTCVFGIAFVLLGNVATNSTQFGIRVMAAADSSITNVSNPKLYNWIVRIIAISVMSAACLLHGTWRRGGIYLNNFFAVVKVALLLFTIAIGLAAYGKAFPATTPSPENLDPHNSFSSATKDAKAAAESFLAIIFAYDGFNQANYVLSEIDNPRRNYKWPAFSAVLLISFLYMFVNIVFMLVVPFELQRVAKADVAELFFKATVGTLNSSDPKMGIRVLNGFMAVSSLGNIIVMTYTAARVKQEIAIEGILPFRMFLSRSVRMPAIPFGKLFGRRSSATEPTPMGALFLHWILSVILVLATASMDPANTYSVLVSLYSYVIDAFFGSILGIGLLVLRIFPQRKWASKSRIGSGLPRVLCIICAFFFTCANLFPVIAYWIPPSTAITEALYTYSFPPLTVPIVAWSVLGAGFVYWIVFYFVIPPLRYPGRKLKTERELYLHEEHGYPVQWHEKLMHDWVVVRNDDGYDGPFLERTVVNFGRD